MLSPGNYIFNTHQRSSVSPLSDMDYLCFTILLRNSLTFCTDTINRKDSASEESKWKSFMWSQTLYFLC